MINRSVPDDGRQRAIIESITPQVDGGRFPAKRVIGDLVTVQAQVAIDNVTWTPGSFLSGKQLTAVASMRHE